MTTVHVGATPGEMLSEWRRLKRLSQLDLALLAGTSARHLSFIETGRSRPSREMVIRLADHLDVPQHKINTLLFAAGYAPDHELVPAVTSTPSPAIMDAMCQVVRGHGPYPALVLSAKFDVLAHNDMAARIISEVDSSLLFEPLNIMRLSLHPLGLAPRIQNFSLWRSRKLSQLHHHALCDGGPELAALYDEVSHYTYPDNLGVQVLATSTLEERVVLPLRITVMDRSLNLMSTLTTFSGVDHAEIPQAVLETFYPADSATEEILREMHDAVDA